MGFPGSPATEIAGGYKAFTSSASFTDTPVTYLIVLCLTVITFHLYKHHDGAWRTLLNLGSILWNFFIIILQTVAGLLGNLTRRQMDAEEENQYEDEEVEVEVEELLLNLAQRFSHLVEDSSNDDIDTPGSNPSVNTTTPDSPNQPTKSWKQCSCQPGCSRLTSDFGGPPSPKLDS